MQVLTFVQIADNVASPDNLVRGYYEKVYQQHDGYKHTLGEGWMEVPTWIPLMSGIFKHPEYDKRLWVWRDTGWDHTILSSFTTKGWNVLWDTIFLGSVMDVNKHIYRHLVEATPENIWVLGGYVDPSYFDGLPNVYWCNSPNELSTLGLFKHPLNWDGYMEYEWFTSKHIPRLSLSEGCFHECTFCTIPRVVTEYDEGQIWTQVNSWALTNYELVYISDKTFGQAQNWRLLKPIGEYLKGVNPNFMGFVVQTTVPYAKQYASLWMHKYHVAYIEVGIEMPDDEFLKRMKKPYRMKQLDSLMEQVIDLTAEFGRQVFIPNLIFGWPEATAVDYARMVRWVQRYQDYIAFVNPFVLCEYHDSKGNEKGEWHTQDTNENSTERSWLTEEQSMLARTTMRLIFATTGG